MNKKITPFQQEEIIRLFHASKNNSSKVIAQELGLSVFIVDYHLTVYFAKKTDHYEIYKSKMNKK